MPGATSSFLFLVVMHLLLVAMHLLLVAGSWELGDGRQRERVDLLRAKPRALQMRSLFEPRTSRSKCVVQEIDNNNLFRPM